MSEQETKATVVLLQSRSQTEQLARLNRITGLTFDSVPTCLIGKTGGLELAQDDGEELIYRALYLWDEK